MRELLVCVAAGVLAVVTASGSRQTPLDAARQVSAPQQAPPVFRTGVDLVQVDVVVLDEKGQPLRGLTKDDFALFDRGLKQEIAIFAAKSHARPPADPFPAPWPADVADNRSAKSDRLVIIILDDLHFRGRSVEAVRLVRRAVQELGDSVSLGLVTTSGTFGIEVTEDRARLLAAVEQFLDRYDPSRAKMAPVTSPHPDFGAPKGPPDLGSFFAPFHAYKTVEDVARMAGANDGRRKAFIWISAGVPGTLHGNSTYADTCGNLSAGASPVDFIAMQTCGMYEKLFRSSVAVYGLSPGGPTDGGRPGVLRDIATETGGFAVRASEMDEGLTRLMADLDNYYLLGFYPAESGRAGYRDLDVVVSRPGVTVRHRAGYHAAGPVPPPKNASPLGDLVAPISPSADLHLRLSATPFFTTGSAMQLLTTIELDLGELPPPTAAGPVRGELEFAVFAVDLKKKKVTRSAGRRVVVDWPEEHRGRPGAERFLVQTVLNVPPGAYQIRASTLSKTPKKSGGVYLQVDVPDGKNRPVALSGILLGSSAAASPRVVESKPPVGFVVPFTPSLDREFGSDEELRVFFQVRRPHARTAVEGLVRLLDPDGVEVARRSWTVASMAPGSVALGLPLASVAPGPYRLVVSSTAGDDVAAPREVRIRVREAR